MTKAEEGLLAYSVGRSARVNLYADGGDPARPVSFGHVFGTLTEVYREKTVAFCVIGDFGCIHLDEAAGTAVVTEAKADASAAGAVTIRFRVGARLGAFGAPADGENKGTCCYGR